MVDLRQLEAFVAISETGTLTGAAGRIGMSQPGLSRLLERLEDELDTDLVTRGRTGAELTDDGRRLLQFAISTLNNYSSMMASVRRRRRGASTLHEKVGVVASTTPGEFLLPLLASSFAEAVQGVAIESLVTDSAAVATLLLEREFDVGFSGMQSSMPGLQHYPVGRDEIVLAVPTGHRLAGRGEVEASELRGERLLRREPGSGTYRTVERAFEEAGVSLPWESNELTLGSTQSIISGVFSGLGAGFVTLRAIERHSPLRIAAVRISGLPITRELFMVYERGREMSPGVKAFVEYVRRWAREENGRSG